MDASINFPSPFPMTKHSTAKALWSMIKNPLDALPPSVFQESIVFTRQLGSLNVYLSDPVLIQKTLVENAQRLSKGEHTKHMLGPALGGGLLTADGAHWKWQRQSVAAAFRHERLLDLQPTMIAAAEQTKTRWLQHDGEVLDVGHEMMRTAFDIIVETMMSGGHGINVSRVERSITDYLEPSGWTLAFGMIGAPEWLPYPGRTRARAAVAFLRASLAAVIAKRRNQANERHDLVSMLLAASDPETGRTMNDEEIIDNLMTLITAGHETTALGLAWTLHLLSRHPADKSKVVREISQVTGGGPVLPEHLTQLIYTKQVFLEAMRLFPPAPIITRTAINDFRLDRYLIPAGTVFFIPIYALHRKADLWPDPESFEPTRFDPENTRTRHRYAYMPFGAGPRVCLGSAFALMEAVAVLAVLLQSFEFFNCTETPPKRVMKITLRPHPTLSMSIRRRRK
ncbi:cytochrome P450 [Sinorhizobium sp. 7-81]|uniref:cytochrome P450 n=1 Tax=unclassified Sinorhizobium TaxID=2613772 RepID=UPI0024C45A5A|nr:MULTISPECIES: cytochrome P450 [unclassified Sinorhizobium]MDK1389264.1 cytochrome P450 [Sinorhizobium sp. 7-81]MDK1493544.1 cytochrome P450 [Sinorhizobium sp. 8-89]